MSKASFSSAVSVTYNLIFKSGSAIKFHFLLACLLDLIVVVLSVAAPAILKHVIDSLSSDRQPNVTIWIATGYGIVWVASEVLLRVRAYITTSVLEQVKLEATKRLCTNSVFRIAEPNKPEIPNGVFAAKMNQLYYSIPIFVDGLVWQVAPLVFRLTLSIGAILSFAPLAYPAILALSVLAFIVVSAATFSSIGAKQGESNLSMQQSTSRILDALKNKQVTVAHAREIQELENVEKSLRESKRINLNTMAYSQMVSGGQILLLGVGLTAMTVKGVFDVSTGLLTIGEFIQINAYILQFLLPISYFGAVLSGIKRSSVSISENAKDLAPYEFEAAREFQGGAASESVLIKNLSVSFGDIEAIKGLNIKVHPGEYIAIVGGSGAGKSTLIRSILGLCTSTSGEIYIGNRRVTEESIRAIRQSIGYVPQDSQLFDRSLNDNVFDGHHDADFRERILRLSGLNSNFLSRSADLTCSHLSGGEKQRVAFARALARRPGLLILDEPSSSLDVRTKEIITSSVLEGLTGITRILITHDLKQASRADRLIVMENGTVTEVGTHQQLIMNDGWYSKNWANC
ncbi:ABC transporter ATP-binding protein [Pseudomonas putida]|uniref:ABC transporter ATP-binding protein n=1 Tax=Pseudomonas putida TaxID=303 RepID=UPI00125F8CE3|nr:ABC transporter ATP-binding protein [Pseudomonas putida]KAB5627008.1 ABC transporter ATP-binding protein [Pseudomonas putida]